MDHSVLNKWIHDEELYVLSTEKRKQRCKTACRSLRAWRRSKLVSIRELSRRSGISYGFISNMERGKPSYTPTLRVLKAYRDHL